MLWTCLRASCASCGRRVCVRLGCVIHVLVMCVRVGCAMCVHHVCVCARASWVRASRVCASCVHDFLHSCARVLRFGYFRLPSPGEIPSLFRVETRGFGQAFWRSHFSEGCWWSCFSDCRSLHPDCRLFARAVRRSIHPICVPLCVVVSTSFHVYCPCRFRFRSVHCSLFRDPAFVKARFGRDRSLATCQRCAPCFRVVCAHLFVHLPPISPLRLNKSLQRSHIFVVPSCYVQIPVVRSRR